MFELLILVIHPFPYFEKVYTYYIIDMLSTKSMYVPVHYYLSDFLFAFMFLRFYYIIRTLMNFSIYSELYSKRVCSKYKVASGTSFCLKALITKTPGMFVLITFSLSIMWLSYLLRIFER